MSEKFVLCLGLAPALQRTLEIPRFEKGRVNRMTASHVSPAGKSVNVGIALHRLGGRPLVTGFNGGACGRAVAGLLKGIGVATRFTRIAGGTRVCTTVVEHAAGEVTEFVEEAPAVCGRERAAFVTRNTACLRRSVALAISGTLPPWADDDFYAPFVALANQRKIPCVIDSHGRGLLAILDQRPAFVKLNRDELRHTAGAAPDDDSLFRDAQQLLQRGVQNLLVTDGANPATLVNAEGGWRFPMPKLDKVVNPIGSGDCTTAGILLALTEGRPLLDAVRLGLGCGCANAMTSLPALFDPGEARRLAERIVPVVLPIDMR